WLPDGTIEFLGREDFQVKVQGHRIELGEIEAALEEHPCVQAAVVLALGEARGAKRLVVCMVPEQHAGESDRTAGAWRSFLADKLPDYMVPTAFVELGELPLTANGMVDRQALVARLGEEPAAEETLVAPRTPLEARLAAMWAEVLGIERVGVEDRLLDLGGNSLTAIQLLTRVRRELRAEVPLRRLFEVPTVAGLAAAVKAVRGEQAEIEEEKLDRFAAVSDPRHRHEPFPLNDVQQAYWVGRSGAFDLGDVAAHAYFELDVESVDLSRINRVLQRLIARHGMLRAIILPTGQQQILAEVPPYEVGTTDLREAAPAVAEARLGEVRARLSHQVLAADRWPLFEVHASLLPGGGVRLHFSFDIMILDAWSFRILWREATALYEDPEREFESLELSFRDYLQAERRFELSQLYQRSRAYWWERLGRLPEAPQLPMAVSPSALRQQRFVRRRGGLSAGRWRRLKARAAGRGLTPSGLLLAAFCEVLALWSRKPRFTINLTTFNRLPLHPQVNDVLGDFTTLTLVAVDVGRPGSFEDRARAVQEQLWEDLEHRYVGGVRVLRRLAQLRGSAAGALMPVVFTSLLVAEGGHAGAGEDEEDTVDASGDGVAFGISQTPQVILDHQVSEARGALRFNWDAVRDLFPPGVLDGMFAAYCDLLAALAAEPDWRRIPRPATSAEHLEVQRAANATAGPQPPGLLHQPFLAQAAAAPERPAVIAPDRTLSYGELDRWSTVLARQLRRLGATRNQLVAVVMEKGWQQVVAVVAVLKAGAAYLPVDSRLPRNRRRHLLEQGEVRLALTQPWLAGELEWPPEVETVAVGEPAAEESAGAESAAARDPGDLAYVIFTSGSTGQPKGVMIDHRAALNTIVDVNERFAVGPGDRVLALSSLGFDLSVYDLFGLLAAGGAVVLPSPSGRREPEHWLDLIARHRVTVWNTVPALMELLLESTSAGIDGSLASLRLVLLSGDWIPLRQPERIRERAPAAAVVSLGGATEASIWSIFHPVAQVDPAWTSIPYGRPLLNQGFHVLDHEQRPRPLWVPGDLYVSGAGLARGYWRDPVKTAARFIPHSETGGRLYRTGDLGRYLPDGTIEFLGREDLQVKVQGHRIELGEIEAALQHHEGVRAAVVTAVADAQGQRRLVAYVVPATQAAPREQEDAARAEAAPAVPEMTDRGSAAAWPADFRWPALPGHRWNRFERLGDEIAKLEFKLAEHGLRPVGRGQSAIPLPPANLDEAARQPFYQRRTWRELDPQPLPLARLGGVLAALRELTAEGSARRRYPAIAGYGVQFRLYVKRGRMAGIAPGVYRYHPAEHRLEVVASEVVIDPAVWTGNDPIFAQAAFALFFVAAASELGRDGTRNSALVAETGAICQLLMEVSPAWGIGFCSIGSITSEHLAGSDLADPSLVLLHNMLGGGLAAAAEPVAGGSGAELELELELEQSPLSERERWQAVAVRGRAEFLAPALSLQAFGRLLACLRQVRLEEFPLPKYRYPSAGGLYPMQVYLRVEPERVEGVAGGLYYYHQRRHALIAMEPATAVAGALAQALAAAPERRALALFLVADVGAIAPIYGPLAEEFCVFEAGSMIQLLIGVGLELGIGFTPLPEIDAAHLEAAADLGPGHLVLQGLAVGAVAPQACLTPVVSHPAPTPAPAQRGADLAASLRNRLREELPDYMVPSQFLFLDTLPLTPNGKIDRKALPVPEVTAVEASPPSGAPPSEMERQLAVICGEIVGGEQFGLHDDFLTVGFTSLHLVRIRNRLDEVLGTKVPIAHFFKYPTIASLARALAEEPQRTEEADRERATRTAEGAQRQKQALKRQRELARRKLRRE
ncbi:MAG: amino acid adenylation domain-containing protein, partial [bacterium]|nr:amino acid adenylation domain-containing protein [bacterium]